MRDGPAPTGTRRASCPSRWARRAARSRRARSRATPAPGRASERRKPPRTTRGHVGEAGQGTAVAGTAVQASVRPRCPDRPWTTTPNAPERPPERRPAARSRRTGQAFTGAEPSVAAAPAETWHRRGDASISPRASPERWDDAQARGTPTSLWALAKREHLCMSRSNFSADSQTIAIGVSHSPRRPVNARAGDVEALAGGAAGAAAVPPRDSERLPDETSA